MSSTSNPAPATAPIANSSSNSSCSLPTDAAYTPPHRVAESGPAPQTTSAPLAPLNCVVNSLAPQHVPAIFEHGFANRPRWLYWKYGCRNGKLTKIPYNPFTFAPASSTDETNWADAWRAWSASSHDRDFAGLGFVFKEGDFMVGVDLDACLSETGELAPFAFECLTNFASYAEFSPSGTGIKIFCRGEYHGARHKILILGAPVINGKTPAIEIYGARRYFAVTGWEYGGPRPLANAQPAIDWLTARYFPPLPNEVIHSIVDDADADPPISPPLSDEEVLAKCASARNAPKFLKLANCDDSDYGNDTSAADLAFVCLLAFYTQNPNQIARIWRNSRRSRPKLNRNDYLFHFTIAKALNGRTVAWNPNNQRETSPTLRNFTLVTNPDGESRCVGKRLEEIAADLFDLTGAFPKAVESDEEGKGTLFAVHSGKIASLNTTSELFAWIGGHAAFDWSKKSSCPERSVFFDYLRLNVEKYQKVENRPHFPRLERFFYNHPNILPGDGVYLRHFIKFFSPATAIDWQLAKAFVMQLFWGGPFGKRPGWIVLGPDRDATAGRGVGKTVFVEKSARLVGGAISFNETALPDAKETWLRLLSPAGRRKRVALIDNLKSLRFSSSLLESLLTTNEISGRQLWDGEGVRPNDLTCCSIVLSLHVPRGRWQTDRIKPVFAANFFSAIFQERVR